MTDARSLTTYQSGAVLARVYYEPPRMAVVLVLAGRTVYRADVGAPSKAAAVRAALADAAAEGAIARSDYETTPEHRRTVRHVPREKARNALGATERTKKAKRTPAKRRPKIKPCPHANPCPHAQANPQTPPITRLARLLAIDARDDDVAELRAAVRAVQQKMRRGMIEGDKRLALSLIAEASQRINDRSPTKNEPKPNPSTRYPHGRAPRSMLEHHFSEYGADGAAYERTVGHLTEAGYFVTPADRAWLRDLAGLPRSNPRPKATHRPLSRGRRR